MTLQIIGRLAGALALTVGLFGCMDVTMAVKVNSETDGHAVMTQTIGAQFYPLIKAGMAGDSDGASDSFCTSDEGGSLVESADGSATCTITRQGKFAALGFDDGKQAPTFTSAGPGLVRVAFPTAEFSAGLEAATSKPGAGAAADDAASKAAEEQMKAAMTAYFAGHFLTVRIEGNEITESNMTISGDRRSAEDKIPLTDIIGGTAGLPAELYAVVRVN